MNREMKDCCLCPRECHVNRLHGEKGYCGQTAEIQAARAALHMWEEPCISGDAGSGAVFFTGCALGCVYCQNHKIAEGAVGKAVSEEHLADIFLRLQEQGAWNINLVTAGHFLPQMIRTLDLAKRRGLHIPVVYNTSGYEKVDALKKLEGYIDIYLPDLKYVDADLAGRYSLAPDYPQVAKDALREMVRQRGDAQFLGERMMRGVIVRHLVLPGLVTASKHVIRYLYETYGDGIFISILNQYTPMPHLENYPELNRKITQEEYDEVVDYAISIGVENGFIQEGDTAQESFIPEFDITGIE